MRHNIKNRYSLSQKGDKYKQYTMNHPEWSFKGKFSLKDSSDDNATTRMKKKWEMKKWIMRNYFSSKCQKCLVELERARPRYFLLMKCFRSRIIDVAKLRVKMYRTCLGVWKFDTFCELPLHLWEHENTSVWTKAS